MISHDPVRQHFTSGYFSPSGGTQPRAAHQRLAAGQHAARRRSFNKVCDHRQSWVRSRFPHGLGDQVLRLELGWSSSVTYVAPPWPTSPIRPALRARSLCGRGNLSAHHRGKGIQVNAIVDVDFFPEERCLQVTAELSVWTSVDDCLAAARIVEGRCLPDDFSFGAINHSVPR